MQFQFTEASSNARTSTTVLKMWPTAAAVTEKTFNLTVLFFRIKILHGTSSLSGEIKL
jgi:hypothetical protein